MLSHNLPEPDCENSELQLDGLFRYYLNNENVPQNHRDDLQLRLIQDRCNSLFSRDYVVDLLDNVNLCSTYPLQIILFEGYLDWNVVGEGPKSTDFKVETLHTQMVLSKACRVRQRFPVPVICLSGKNICRSGGLVEKAELFVGQIKQVAKTPKFIIKKKVINTSKSDSRQQDTVWLSMLKVYHIIDFMNETMRSFMGIVPLCSGEVESHYHDNFSISTMPFPGVESYKNIRETVNNGDPLPHLRCQNDKDKAQAELHLNQKIQKKLHFIEWLQYRHWDITELTQNYLLYIFRLLRSKNNNNEGILIHCISGWDRTPLWIGILRILLWAEGLVHQSLDAEQILYLVIAYDWLLFGHQLASRLKENSEIMYYAFWVLTKLIDHKYSLSLDPGAYPIHTDDAGEDEESSETDVKMQNGEIQISNSKDKDAKRKHGKSRKRSTSVEGTKEKQSKKKISLPEFGKSSSNQSEKLRKNKFPARRVTSEELKEQKSHRFYPSGNKYDRFFFSDSKKQEKSHSEPQLGKKIIINVNNIKMEYEGVDEIPVGDINSGAEKGKKNKKTPRGKEDSGDSKKFSDGVEETPFEEIEKGKDKKVGTEKEEESNEHSEIMLDDETHTILAMSASSPIIIPSMLIDSDDTPFSVPILPISVISGQSPPLPARSPTTPPPIPSSSSTPRSINSPHTQTPSQTPRATQTPLQTPRVNNQMSETELEKCREIRKQKILTVWDKFSEIYNKLT